MLRWRLILGALFIAALVILCWLDAVVTRPGAILLPIALLLSWLAVAELLAMFNQRDRHPVPWTMYCGVLLAVALSGISLFWPAATMGNRFVGLGWLAIGLVFALLLALVGELRRFDGLRQSTVNLALSALAILYVGGLLGVIVQLRVLSAGPDDTHARLGMLALISLVATVKMSDIGQYTFGRLFGRNKLSPIVSPGKTWEGAAGGMLVAIGTAWFVFTWVSPRMLGSAAPDVHWLAITLFGAAVAVAGILGDLGESMLKRDAGVKDSSTWMPGFGGVLDLLDSLLGAAPVAFFFWVLAPR